MNNSDVKLEWALVDGTVQHISQFVGYPRGSRPAACCEVCRGVLIMRLGSIRAHHYAHTADERCPLTSPETARHYNTKHVLAAKLRDCNDLYISIPCTNSNFLSRCVVTGAAAKEWDTVAVEALIHPVRPDILLLGGGTPLLAIEVRATNAVSEQKAEQLKSAGIPWIEVEAGPSTDQWVSGSPLTVLKQASIINDDRCLAHQVNVPVWRVPPVTLQEEAVITPRNKPEPSLRKRSNAPPVCAAYRAPDLFRVVDCYPHNGRRVRRIFWAHHTLTDDGKYRIAIRDPAIDDPIVEVISVEEGSAIPTALDLHLRRYLKARYAHYDCVPKNWRPAAEFPSNPALVYHRSFMPVRFVRGSAGNWIQLNGR